MKIFYEVKEFIDNSNIIIPLDNLNYKIENLSWCKFKTYEDARKRIEIAIQKRKNQYYYYEDTQHNIQKKISYYEKHKIEYKIYKIVVNEEMIFSCNNDDMEIKENTDTSLQEFITI